MEACWAHNPEVRGSKPRSANSFCLGAKIQIMVKFEYVIFMVCSEAAAAAALGYWRLVYLLVYIVPGLASSVVIISFRVRFPAVAASFARIWREWQCQ